MSLRAGLFTVVLYASESLYSSLSLISFFLAVIKYNEVRSRRFLYSGRVEQLCRNQLVVLGCNVNQVTERYVGIDCRLVLIRVYVCVEQEGKIIFKSKVYSILKCDNL